MSKGPDSLYSGLAILNKPRNSPSAKIVLGLAAWPWFCEHNFPCSVIIITVGIHGIYYNTTCNTFAVEHCVIRGTLFYGLY